jgi:hypothetical protein
MDFLGYIDPGAGSIALQALIGLGLGVTLAARTRIANLIDKIRRKDSSSKENS